MQTAVAYFLRHRPVPIETLKAGAVENIKTGVVCVTDIIMGKTMLRKECCVETNNSKRCRQYYKIQDSLYCHPVRCIEILNKYACLLTHSYLNT